MGAPVGCADASAAAANVVYEGLDFADCLAQEKPHTLRRAERLHTGQRVAGVGVTRKAVKVAVEPSELARQLPGNVVEVFLPAKDPDLVGKGWQA